ncbi:unnamed protein product [Echinostoma caproni]|uniref:Conserved oligomeric Golgi complex subunit 2 n=1 Tax=Echinostoma caproni TaxID=27848 RepID=A0A183ALG5_9TREM|nr:unnamed protein product [Echinostoma caproni]
MLITDSDQPVTILNRSDLEGTMSTSALRQPHKLLLEDTFDIAPTGLKFCFDRECFLNDNFLSDEFILSQDARGTSLEQMRDSLLQYSNILKSSLVELINQDYADFVNLSTNLVGLDKAIDVIATPLNDLESSVQEVLNQLSSIEEQLSSQLKERQRIREKKELLNSLQIIDGCVSRLERWLTNTGVEPALTEHRSTDEIPVVSARTKQTTSGTGDTEDGVNDAHETLLIGTDLDAVEGVSDWPAEFYANCSYVCLGFNANNL